MKNKLQVNIVKLEKIVVYQEIGILSFQQIKKQMNNVYLKKMIYF